MAKRRILKKAISEIAAELFTETLFCFSYIPGTDKEKADRLLDRVSEMEDGFIRRTGSRYVKECGETTKSYFKKLRAELQNEVNSIAEEIAKLN